MAEEGWEPKIVAFCCNWCSYGGADTAGMGRFQQPASTRVIKVMCSGRIDPLHVFNAFLEGADAYCHRSSIPRHRYYPGRSYHAWPVQ